MSIRIVEEIERKRHFSLIDDTLRAIDNVLNSQPFVIVNIGSTQACKIDKREYAKFVNNLKLLRKNLRKLRSEIRKVVFVKESYLRNMLKTSSDLDVLSNSEVPQILLMFLTGQ